MWPERTIVLDLIARGPDLLGDARLTYSPAIQTMGPFFATSAGCALAK